VKDVREVFSRGSMLNIDIPSGDAFVDVVLANIDVFDACVSLRVARKRRSSQIIAVENCRTRTSHTT
jgi:hypothetical protein